MRASAARIRKLRLGYGGFVAVAVKAGHARSGVSASGVELVLRSRQFPTLAFNSSKKFSTTISSLGRSAPRRRIITNRPSSVVS